MLTEVDWSASSSVFFARALAYAERLIARQPTSPRGWWRRGYTWALLGRHHSALADLKKAGELAAAETERSAAQPVWLDLLEAYSRYDREKLLEERDDTKQLARLLQLQTVLYYGSSQSRLLAARRVLDAAPDCYLAINRLTDVPTLGTRRSGAELGFETAARHLPDRLKAIDDLPDEARRALSDEPGEDERLIGPRAAAVDALCAAAEADAGEPSWAVLATLVDDLNFKHASREIDFLSNWLSVDVEEELKELQPLYAKHSFGAFLESESKDARRARRAAEALKQSLQAPHVWLHLHLQQGRAVGVAEPGSDWREWRFGPLQLRHMDETYGNIVGAAPEFRYSTGARQVRRLLAICPHWPISHVYALLRDPNYAKQQGRALEDRFPREPAVCRALGLAYLAWRRYDDAERLLDRALDLEPNEAVYRELGDLHIARGNREKWKELMDDYLAKTEPLGLEHARARCDVAEWLMSQGQWREAQPYADEAAETFANWCWSVPRTATRG